MTVLQPIFLSAATVAAFASPSWAQTANDDGNSIQLGGALAYIPEYAGSSDYDLRVLPFIGFDDIAGFELNGLALSYPLVDIGTGRGPGTWSLEAGARAAFDFGRDSDDSPTLTGFEDIDPSLLTGGFINANYGLVSFRLEGGQDVIGGHDGFIADVSIGTFVPPGVISDRLTLIPSLTLSWADENHNQAIYGVTAQQAAASILPQYDLGSGFHRASANLVAQYKLDDKWQLTLITSYREYLNDFRDSPILQAPDGATSDVFTILGISRSFGF